MPEYLSPGVYVEEVPSPIKPIAGVSTSTAAFIGIVPPTINIVEEDPAYDPTKKTTPADKDKGTPGENLPYRTWQFPFPTDFKDLSDAQKNLAGLSEDPNSPVPRPSAETRKDLKKMQDFRASQSTVNRYSSYLAAGTMAVEGEPVLCTSFGDFKKNFGGFSDDGLGLASGAEPTAGTGMQNQLAHAVFGFFNNGGTRCYVMRYHDLPTLRSPESLSPLEAIDEISIVAAPGIIDQDVQTNIVDHCTNMRYRFAILDAPVLADNVDLTLQNIKKVNNTDHGALYFPWIKVFDSPTQFKNPAGNGAILSAPSGHIAGIYARVDHERGVFKAPANEVVRGALDLDHQVSKNIQDGLNPAGINCIRYINDNITVWGARTVGGDANSDLKYVNVRRTLIFIEKSIDEGTQWVVFEPNDRSLWAKITRNVTAFLTTVWRDGALFGSTPAEAFYVKCDDETNPPENRDLGRVTTEIGVAIVRPAEFVIFRISQWAGPQGQQ
jgi:phage tail sheath protein FI